MYMSSKNDHEKELEKEKVQKDHVEKTEHEKREDEKKPVCSNCGGGHFSSFCTRPPRKPGKQ